LLPGKTLDSFDFDVVPMISKAHVMAICASDSWIDKGASLILIGGSGGGKTHLASAIGLALTLARLGQSPCTVSGVSRNAERVTERHSSLAALPADRAQKLGAMLRLSR